MRGQERHTASCTERATKRGRSAPPLTLFRVRSLPTEPSHSKHTHPLAPNSPDPLSILWPRRSTSPLSAWPPSSSNPTSSTPSRNPTAPLPPAGSRQLPAACPRPSAAEEGWGGWRTVR
eukprot:529703-Rhodomonas_salina.1